MEKTLSKITTHKHYFLALLLFMVVFVLFFNIAREGSRNFFHVGDHAALELRVVNAARNVQCLGPYSRFGWNHPGPMYFYILLPFYKVFGMGTQSLYVGAVFINIISLLAVLFFLYKSSERHFFYFMAFLLALYIYYFLGLRVIREIWNPYVTILPFAAFVFMSAYLALGNLNILPLSVFFATFTVQTHVAYIPAVIVICLLSLLFCGVEKWQISKSIKALVSKEVVKPIGISVGLFMILWLPPIIETLKNQGQGNLFKLVYYFIHAQAGHSFSEAVAAVSSVTNAPAAGFLNKLPGLFLLLQAGLAAAAAIYHFVHKRKYLSYLLVFGLVGLVVSVISAVKITGPIHVYLIRWMSVFGFINWGIIFFTIFCFAAAPLTRVSSSKIFVKYGKIAGYSTIIILAAVLFGLQQKNLYFASHIKQDEERYRHIGDISNAIINYVNENNISSFLMKPYHSLWVTGAGVANQLYKASVPFSLEDNWLFWFGYQFKKTREETDVILFKLEKEPMKDAPNHTLIYHSGKCSVYYRRKDRFHNN